ncbi:hypothetical protein F2Q68_00007992 [Brassica cretica]|uniref:RNase H type-1 domain-containing protein n=1 Tax=Brassica cretica TaxID=69181 RepID=A0A8S9KUV3_BRACR|nr:hypothetical protein F2Q68_00007992 [Brassica cretica]
MEYTHLRAGALAVKERLRSRGINIDTTFSSCGNGREDINHVLFQCRKMNTLFPDAGLVSPWLLWHIWKARNVFCFEYKRLDPANILDKAIMEAQIWRELQVPPRSETPLVSFNNGGAWIVRNPAGMTLLHSRRAFSNVSTPLEADLCSLLWSIESMRSLRLNKIIFESSSAILRDAFLNPSFDSPTWPMVLNILHTLDGFGEWRVEHVVPESNKVASMIASSVTKDRHYQSYVASGGPSWLRNLLEQEAGSPHQ